MMRWLHENGYYLIILSDTAKTAREAETEREREPSLDGRKSKSGGGGKANEKN